MMLSRSVSVASLVFVSGLFVAAAGVMGCHTRSSTNVPDEDTEDSGPVVQAKASGAVATLGCVVHGAAPERYKRALERALLRSNLKVVDAASTTFDLELVLDVSSEVQEEIDADADPNDPNTIGHEMAKYLAQLSVRAPDGTVLDRIEATPDFELRWLTSTGAAIKTIRSKEQADVEFSGEAMNTLASKIATSEAVGQLAAKRPAAPSK